MRHHFGWMLCFLSCLDLAEYCKFAPKALLLHKEDIRSQTGTRDPSLFTCIYYVPSLLACILCKFYLLCSHFRRKLRNITSMFEINEIKFERIRIIYFWGCVVEVVSNQLIWDKLKDQPQRSLYRPLRFFDSISWTSISKFLI